MVASMSPKTLYLRSLISVSVTTISCGAFCSAFEATIVSESSTLFTLDVDHVAQALSSRKAPIKRIILRINLASSNDFFRFQPSKVSSYSSLMRQLSSAQRASVSNSLFSLSGAKGNRSSCSTAAFSPSEAKGEQVIIQFLFFTRTKTKFKIILIQKQKKAIKI